VDGDAPADVELQLGGVVLQIAGVVVLRDEATEGAGHRVAGEPGEAPRRVEVEAVVAVAPRGPDALVAVQDDRPAPAPSQAGGHREPRRTGADDDDLRLVSAHEDLRL
jgi:hypothetical protein